MTTPTTFCSGSATASRRVAARFPTGISQILLVEEPRRPVAPGSPSKLVDRREAVALGRSRAPSGQPPAEKARAARLGHRGDGSDPREAGLRSLGQALGEAEPEDVLEELAVYGLAHSVDHDDEDGVVLGDGPNDPPAASRARGDDPFFDSALEPRSSPFREEPAKTFVLDLASFGRLLEKLGVRASEAGVSVGVPKLQPRPVHVASLDAVALDGIRERRRLTGTIGAKPAGEPKRQPHALRPFVVASHELVLEEYPRFREFEGGRVSLAAEGERARKPPARRRKRFRVESFQKLVGGIEEGAHALRSELVRLPSDDGFRRIGPREADVRSEWPPRKEAFEAGRRRDGGRGLSRLGGVDRAADETDRESADTSARRFGSEDGRRDGTGRLSETLLEALSIGFGKVPETRTVPGIEGP